MGGRTQASSAAALASELWPAGALTCAVPLAKRCARRPRAAHDDGVVMVSLHHDPLTHKRTKKEAPRVFNGQPRDTKCFSFH